MKKSLALLGGEALHPRPQQIKWPVSGDEELVHLRDVLDSSMWSRYPQGQQPNKRADKIQQLQEEFCSFLGARNGFAVTNGTVALEIACRSLLLKPGDEIITPAYSFVSSATCVFAARAIPVFVDLDPETLCISPDRIEEAITPRTRAIIAVHLDGYVCDMDRIMEIARRHNLAVIEDCARAPGSEWRGQKVGTIGHFGCFSFWTSKHMTCGEGGFLCSNDDDLFLKAESIANQGRARGGDFYEHPMLGGNGRMSQFQAAVLLGQLSRYPQQMEQRERNMEHLQSLLKDQAGFRAVRRDPRATRLSYYFAVFHYDPEAFGGVSRDLFAKAVTAEGSILQTNFDTPLSRNGVFSEEGLRANQLEFLYRDHGRTIDYQSLSFPVVESNTTLRRQHRTLLGGPEQMEHLAEAVKKVHACQHELVEFELARDAICSR